MKRIIVAVDFNGFIRTSFSNNKVTL